MLGAMRPLIVILLTAALPLSAQFWARLGNPSVDVGILHPPELGLKVSRVTLAPSRSHASLELAEALAADLVRQRDLEVVAKGDVDLLDRAQEMAARGVVDSALVAQLGRALGPVVLLTTHVSRAEFKHQDSSKDTKDKDGKITATTRTTTTTLEFEANLQMVDGATGKLLGTAQIHETPSASTSSDKGRPAPPDVRELRRKVYDVARDRVLRLLLPWTETTKQIFFDDKAYRMDQAATLMKANDLSGAQKLAESGAAEAEADVAGEAKLRARAVYNLGIVAFAQGNPAIALPKFRRALEILPDAGIFKDALKDAQRAVEVQATYDRYQRSADLTARTTARPATHETREALSGRTRTPEERLEDLDRLWNKGLLSEDEYRAKRAEILKAL
jgi:tetratricopeptide (TPR) repeat protein